MHLYCILLTLTTQFLSTNTQCSTPIKFYLDCGQTRSSSQAALFCRSLNMTLVNLTNGSTTLVADILLLNSTFRAQNCNGYFWFSSGSQSGLVVNINELGSLIGGLLSGVLNIVLCLIPFLCPVTTTAAPITQAYTVCTRPAQQRVIQKCLTQGVQSSIRNFQFVEKSMFGGVLSRFPLQSKLACSALCSSNADCVGISYIDKTCTLYI